MRTATHGNNDTPGVGCAVFGHDYDFRAQGPTMRWDCSRGCGAGGAKTYPSAEEAKRYAAVFDQRADRDLGKRAPLIGLLPLRLWRRIRAGSLHRSHL